jgi:hypothetical protein
LTSVNLSALAAAPLFAPLRPFLQYFETDRLPSIDELNGLIEKFEVVPKAGSGRAIRFVAAGATAKKMNYEQRVFATGEVETRPGSWHDLFNALAWLAFPQTKAALNSRHCSIMDERRVRGLEGRGPLRDVATLFDENGVIVTSADRALSELLRDHEWKQLFWRQRADLLERMRFVVFGHGLYDKLRVPFIGLCGKAVLLDVGRGHLDLPLGRRLEIIDRELASRWRDGGHYRAPRDLAPLPLLGLPGVVPENAAAEYYDDPRQFRPKRRT